MNKLRAMVIFGTRPEAIKLAPIILEMQRGTHGLAPYVCVTAQHRHMLDQVTAWFGIIPDCDLNLMQENQALPEFAARALTALTETMRDVKPDIVVVQGDTTTAMIAAMAAFYQRVPVAHVEAGLRTKEVYSPFPEEMNRRVASVLSTFHFAPTEKAAGALVREHVPKDCVFTVGNTVIDALRLTLERNPATECIGTAADSKMILVTAHRRENFGAPLESICRAIRTLADENEEVSVVYPVHLNPNVREPVERLLGGHSRIRLIKPLPYEEFAKLMVGCHLILTDSGGIQEEATFLGKPTLIMRDTTERSEAIECGSAALVGTESERIVSLAQRLLDDSALYESMSRQSAVFGNGHAAAKILDILAQKLSSN